MNFKSIAEGFFLFVVFIFLLGFLVYGSQMLLEQNKVPAILSVSGAVLNKNIPQKKLQAEELNIDAQSAISVWTDFSGSKRILFDRDNQKILSIASISKLMSALIVIENFDLSQQIIISDDAAQQGSPDKLIKAGEMFYAKDLLHAMIIGSDNTAASALAESAGTEKFVELMNSKAKEIGLSDSSFLNPTGLGLNNFSSAGDLAKLAEYLLKKQSSIFRISTMQEFDLYTVDRKILHKIINTDELLKTDSNFEGRIIGGKTGVTRTAGQCLLLVLSAPDSTGYIINVILNSKNRFGEMEKMINWTDTAYY